MRPLAKTDLVVLGPFELEVHCHSESKDSEKYDGPFIAVSVGQTWRLGKGYEWQFLVTALGLIPISVSELTWTPRTERILTLISR